MDKYFFLTLCSFPHLFTFSGSHLELLKKKQLYKFCHIFKMEGSKLKFVDYSENSGSSRSPNTKVKYSYPKIAVVNPIQNVRPEPQTEPEQPTSQHDETIEFDPDEFLTRQPLPSTSDDQP